MPNVALLPVTQNPDQLLTYIEENFRRIAAAFSLPIQPEAIVSVPASKITAGTFVSGVLLPAAQISGSIAGTQITSLPASKVTTGTFGAGAFTFPAALTAVSQIRADTFKINVDNTWDAKIDLYGGTYLIGIRSSEMYFKSFGGKFGFEGPSGVWGMRYGPGEVEGSITGLMVNGDIQLGSWVRANQGFYNRLQGGGIYMDNTTWVKVYNTKPLYSRKAGADWSDHAVIAIENTGSAVGYTLYNENVTAYCISVGYGSSTVRVVNYNESQWAPITASAFTVGSTRAEKHDIRPLSYGQKIKQIKPVKFKRERTVICLRCDGKGRTSMADWIRRVDHYDPTPDMSPELLEVLDCPTCSKNGVPGQINTPAIDKTEDTDFLGFIAEEVAEYAPEAIFWGPADRNDPMSEAVPMALDVMAMIALVTQEVKTLDARLDDLERKR